MEAIVEEYVARHRSSAEFYEKAKNIIPAGVSHDYVRLDPFPLYIGGAEGCRKWDVDDNEFLDFRCGNGSLILGHAYPDIVEVVTNQVAKGTHYASSHELEIVWAQWVKDLIPSAAEVTFHNSGTEATLMAMRLARAFTGKNKIVKFRGHYHGWHDYAMLGADHSLAGIPETTQSSVIILPPGEILAVEETLHKNSDIAAVILEPTGGHLGNLALRPTFLGELREVTRRYGVLLIFDEAVTGFRVSRGGAQGRYNVFPDLTALAKVLGGGLPSGAVAGRAEIMEMIRFAEDDDIEWNSSKRVPHMGNFNANPLSAAAGSKALEIIATTPVNSRADEMAKRLKDGLNDLLARMEIPGCATGVASLVQHRIGLPHECDKEVCVLTVDQMRKAQNPTVMKLLNLALKNYGVDMGFTTLFVSCVHNEQDVDETVEAYEKALTDVRKEGVI